MRPFLLFLALLVTGSTTALGEINVGLTLESLADTCPYIGIYSLASVSYSSPYLPHVEASLVKKLRGEPPEKVTFSYASLAGLPKVTKPEKGDRFMVFFRNAAAKDIRMEEVIGLTKIVRGGQLSLAVEPDFSVVSSGAAIQKIVTDRIASKPVQPLRWREYPDNRFRLEVPHGTPAYGALFAGSSCFLIVPDDLLALSKAHPTK